MQKKKSFHFLLSKVKKTHTHTNPSLILESIRSTVMKHDSVRVLPALNGTVTHTVWRARASRRTGGELIMWKMRAWKASVEVGTRADEGYPPRARRSWPDWEQDQRCAPAFCLPAPPPPFSPRRSHNSILPPPFSCGPTCCSTSFCFFVLFFCFLNPH